MTSPSTISPHAHRHPSLAPEELLSSVRAVIPPPGLLSWAWVIAAVAVGIGIAGVILRWPAVGWDATSTENAPTSRPSRPTMRAVLTCIYAAAGAGLVVVLA